MKTIILFIVTYLAFFNKAYSQETVELAQLFLGIQGVGSSEVVYHTIEASGVVWEKSGNNFIISEDENIYISIMYSTGNFTSGNPDTRAPFNWVWLSQQGRVAPWGLGLYKITNSKVSGKYFYLDTRDNEYVENPPGDNPDVWFVYYVEQGKYRCIVKCDEYIENGSLVRVSDILGHTSKTDMLEDFWENALAVTNNGNNNPRIVWGPYPNPDNLPGTITGYKVYRSANHPPGSPGSFSLLATINDPSQYHYTDNSATMGTDYNANSYYVKAVYQIDRESSGETAATNTVEVRLEVPQKRGSDDNKTSLSEFNLDQNFPNPFNPETNISFSVPIFSFVSLKVYDILGNQVAELVNETKESGNYSVSFDASRLASGLYFYTLSANGNSITKKMLLAK